MNIKTVMVVGAGQMGSGIAQVAAQAGCAVILHDIEPIFVEKGVQNITNNLNRDVQKQRKTEAQKQEILARIRTTTDLKAAKDADIVIEAASENMAIKSQIFRQLDQIAPERTILATNTSSLPITEIAAVTTRADRVIGMHFMNPVPVMQLVEIIRGLATSDATFAAVRALSDAMGKVSVEVNDAVGFVSNRVLMPMINEAIYCVYEGVATPQDVDAVMKLGMNHPMGPLVLADFIGLDTCLAIMNVLYEGFNDSKYRPCPLLKKYVAAGWLGKKSGKGFYEYS